MNPEPSNATRLLRVLVVLPPLALLGWLVIFNTSNVVWGDGVSMCPVFDHFYRSTLTFAELWAPYQGHRILCHRGVELLLGLATHWNVHYEIGLIYLTLALDFCLLWWLLQDLRASVTDQGRLLLLGLCSLFIFSASQSEVWTNGFNLGPAINATSVLLGIAILAKFGANFPALLGCLLAGVVASYSYGNGLAYWLAMAPLLAVKLRHDPRWRGKWLLWILVAAVIIGLYFDGLGSSGGSMSLGQALFHVVLIPGRFFVFLLTCAGASVFYLNGEKAAVAPWVRLLLASGAPLCGAVGLAGAGWVAWRLRRRAEEWVLLAPWVALGLYAVATVGIISLTRYGGASAAAISSRYVLFSQYLWLALFVCLARLAPAIRRSWVWTLASILLVCYGISYANGLRRARETSMNLRQARAELLTVPTVATYRRVNPDRDPAQVADFMRMNREHRLALFHVLSDERKP